MIALGFWAPRSGMRAKLEEITFFPGGSHCNLIQNGIGSRQKTLTSLDFGWTDQAENMKTKTVFFLPCQCFCSLTEGNNVLHPLQCQSGPAPALLLLCIAINVVSRKKYVFFQQLGNRNGQWWCKWWWWWWWWDGCIMGLNSISIDASVSHVHPDAIVCPHQHPTHSTSDISANLLPTHCRRTRILSSYIG